MRKTQKPSDDVLDIQKFSLTESCFMNIQCLVKELPQWSFFSEIYSISNNILESILLVFSNIVFIILMTS